jgi:hypothetical protein
MNPCKILTFNSSFYTKVKVVFGFCSGGFIRRTH